MVGTVAIDGILGQGTLSPGVDAAHTMDIKVDIEINKTATLEVLSMTGSSVKVFFTIIPGTDAEGLEPLDAEGSSRR